MDYARAIRRGCICVSSRIKVAESLDVTACSKQGHGSRPMQSHGGQVRHLADIPRWCDDVTDSTGPGRFARRSLLKAAVLGRRDELAHPLAATGEEAGVTTADLLYTVTGRILDVSPHVLVLR